MGMEPDSQLPEELVEALKDSERPVALITARVDREIDALASAHFADRRQRRRNWPAWAAAASVLLAVVLSTTYNSEAPAPVALYTDIDGSGSIDIADVLAAAHSGQGFTQEELDAFAMSLVALGEDAS